MKGGIILIHLKAAINGVMYLFRRFVLHVVDVVEKNPSNKEVTSGKSLKKAMKINKEIKNYSYACWLCKAESQFSQKPPNKTEVILKTCRMCGVPNKVKVHPS